MSDDGADSGRVGGGDGRGKDVESLVEVDYAEDGRAAFVDWYDY